MATNNNTFTIKQGALEPPLRVQLKDALRKPVTLPDGATAKIRIRTKGDPATTQEYTAIIEDATKGILAYNWQAGQTDTAGEYEVEWVITYLGGRSEVYPSDGCNLVKINTKL